jgi:DNA-binding response OmpR family regulator
MTTQTAEQRASRPCMIVAHTDADYAASTHLYFQRRGWEVCQAQSGAEVRRLAGQTSPAVVVLATELGDESGWLTCDKLTRQQPGVRVILVGAKPTPVTRHFAAFVGAAGLVNQEDGVAGLADGVPDAADPAVR